MFAFVRRWAAPIVAVGTVLSAAANVTPAAAASPHGSHHDRIRAAGTSAQPAAAAPLASGGGAIVTAPIAYLSFWGPEWASGFSTGGYSSATAANYVESFFQAIGGSGWSNVMTQYCQGVSGGTTTCPSGATFVGNPSSQYGGAWVDTTPVPASPVDSDIAAAADRAARHFGYRQNAVYIVMSPTGKSESGFGTSWCAWHGDNYGSAGHEAYAYLPYFPDAGYACGVNSVNTNDSFGHGWFDGFSIVGGHEFAEAITDPYPAGGWTDSAGEENADKCEWGGRQANYTFSSTYFAVQPTWSNALGGCAMTAAGSTPPPAPGPAPAPAPPPSAYSAYFDWYDNASPGVVNDNIHIVNPSGSTVTGTLQLGSRTVPFSIAGGGQGYYPMPAGSVGGPLVLSAGARVIASQRVQYYQSFNEVPARTASDASNDLWFTWYDAASPGMSSDSLVVVNPGSTAASGTVVVGPAASPIASSTFGVNAGGAAAIAFPAGVIGGPVHIHSNGSAVLASQRVLYYSTFNEVVGQSSAPTSAGTTLYFNWYDKASPGMLNDNVHVTNPTSSPVSGTVRLTQTGQSVGFSIPALSGTYVNFPPGTIGGPIVITASAAIIASQRVQYFGSFNEVAGKTVQDAATTQYMPWYDLASPGMLNDNVHLLNPSGGAVSGTVTLVGQTSVPFSVAAGGETYVNLGRRIGGPVVITVSGGGGVIASQRVQYFQSFNEAAASA